MPEGNLLKTLRALHGAGVDFIIVGGVAASLHGAPGQTIDIDLVHSEEAANIARLLALLDELDAVYRIQPERRLRPTAGHLALRGPHNLLTRHGPLDLHRRIGRDLGYQDLLPHTVEMDIGEGIRVRVLDLETLIAIKEELAGEKDLAVLPILQRTLAEKRRTEGR